MAAEIRSAPWRSGIVSARRRRCFPPPPRRMAVASGSPSRSKRMFVFGVGFVGRYVADRLLREGWEVFGTCTSAIKKRELVAMGLDAFIFDVTNSKLSSLPTLQYATHVLISIPPVVGIGDPLLCHREELRSTLNPGNLQWLCYLSSTSIYGDCGGASIDEDYPANPKTDSAKSRFAAEKGWLEIGQDLSVPVNVFRLGGIYGPGRSALDTIIKQKPMSRDQKMRESRVYTARVHVADIYQAMKASFDVPYSGIYNVVDDDPAPRAEVFSFARGLIEKRWPNITIDLHSADGSGLEIQKREMGGEKRVSNARLKKELGIELLYPTYQSGLQSILDSWESCPNQA